MKKFIKHVSFFVFIISCSLVHAQANGEENSTADNEGAEGIEVPEPRSPWAGRVDLGFTWQEGRSDKSEVSLRGEAEREFELNELRALAEFLYGEVDGVRNTQRFTSSFRWRRDMSERFFSQTLTQYESDRVRGIRNRVEQNVGIGYRFVQTERLEGSVVPGFTAQYTDETGVNDHWSYLASISQDLSWEISSAYSFEQDLNFLIDPADTDDHILRFNAGIFGTLTDSINLSLRYQYLYENQVRPEVAKTDQRVIASVGYSF